MEVSELREDMNRRFDEINGKIEDIFDLFRAYTKEYSNFQTSIGREIESIKGKQGIAHVIGAVVAAGLGILMGILEFFRGR